MLQLTSACRSHIGEQALRLVDACHATSSALLEATPQDQVDAMRDAVTREAQYRKELSALAEDEKAEVSPWVKEEKLVKDFKAR